MRAIVESGRWENLLTSLVATTGVFQQTGQKLRDDGNRYALYSFIIGIGT